MATKVRWKWFLIPMLGLALLAGGVVVQVEAGKPAPPPPPPVHYWITWFDTGHPYVIARDVNTLGDVVGDGYDDGTWVALPGGGYNTPNQTAFLFEAGTVSDINALAAVPGGFTAASAMCINESGQIVGKAVNHLTGETRGYVFDRNAVQQFVLLPLPSHPDGSAGWQYACGINIDGDIVAWEQGGWIALYHWNGGTCVLRDQWQMNSQPTAINDNGDILTLAGQRYTPGTGWEDFSTAYGINFAMAMNNDGTFVGNRFSNKLRAFRFSEPEGVMLNLTTGGAGTGVNSSGDFCLRPSMRACVYTDYNNYGLLQLDNMVTGTSPDVTKWMNASGCNVYAITDRHPTPTPNFGSICGYAFFQTTTKGQTTTTEQCFLLTPVP